MSHQRNAVQIITPFVSRAKHFGFTLDNGVKCIVIQDPNAKVPAAAMNISAGQVNDPEVLPGLAHFCEHMLFMGTEKYPCEDEYHEYISKNSGYCNAWTAHGETTYYFTVTHEALEGALERFVEFFVSPSFNPSALVREVKAVHSEDEKNHNVDFWRVDELVRSLFDPRHPRSRYGNGNLTTLWDEPLAKQVDIRSRLLEFFQTHYVSEAACVAVHSVLSPDSVLRIIEGPLSRMRRGKPAPRRFISSKDPVFTAATRELSWINVRTIKKNRTVRVAWPVKSSVSLWRTMPSAYILHILGHECNCSVLGVLKGENMATGLFASSHRIDDDNDLLYVDIALTRYGVTRIVDVIDILYQGVGQAARVDCSVYDQIKAEARLKFESSDIDDPANHCSSLACFANETDLEHCWVAQHVALEDDFAATEAYVAQLTPENCVVMFMWGEMPCDVPIVSSSTHAKSIEEKKNKGDDEEDEEIEEECEANLFDSLPDFARVACNSATRFHGTKFAKCHIPDEVIAQWSESSRRPHHPVLNLPPANPFISTDFTVYCGDGSDGNSVIETFRTPYGVTLVRKDAGRHKSFKTSIQWRGNSPCAYASAKNAFYTKVLKKIFSDVVAETSYFGLLAALENDIGADVGGMSLSVTGPQHRILEFFFAIFEKAFTFDVLCSSEEKYAIYAEEEMRVLASNKSKQPYLLAHDVFLKAARVVAYTPDEVRSAAAAYASYADYQSFVREYFESGVYFECFVAGNVPSSDYVREFLIAGIEDRLKKLGVPPARKESIPRYRDVYAFGCASCIPSATLVDVLSYPPFDMDNPNTAVILNIYIGEETPLLRALCDCIHNLISSSFFAALRTKEALGYIVFSRSIRIEGVAHLQFCAQSALEGVDALYLLSRIIAFLSAVEENLATVCDEAEVRTAVNGLVQLRRKLPSSVEKDCTDLAKRYFHPAGLEYKELEIAELERLSSAKVTEFFKTFVANSSGTRRALAVVVHNAASAAGGVIGSGSGGCCEVALPPRRQTDESAGCDDGVSKGLLQLPDFVSSPMNITLREYMSPEDYNRNFAIVRSKSF